MTIRENFKSAHLANELSKLDNLTLAKILSSVLKNRTDSDIFKGVKTSLDERILKAEIPKQSDIEQSELF